MRSALFVNRAAVELTFENCVARVFAYNTDGTFIGVYSGDGFTKDWSQNLRLTSPVNLLEISDEDYLYRIVFDRYTGAPSAEATNAYLKINKIDELQNENTAEEVYIVGADGDFATFTAMLIALKDNSNPKTVYVSGGTYDIFNEIGGAAYMQTVDTSANWRDVSNIVPPNTTIVGVGDVTLTWNPSDTEIIDQAHAFLFSPLNLSGTCTIKNINIVCSNCRYGIHDETSGLAVNNGAVHIFENVSVIYTASTYGVKYAYGAGHNRNMTCKFKNCLFSAGYASSWSTHDWPASVNERSIYEFDNCVFMDNRTNTPAGIRLSSSDTVGRLDDVKLNACVFAYISFNTEGSSNVKQGYKVQTMLCKSYTTSYSTYIQETDRIAPIDYLQLT